MSAPADVLGGAMATTRRSVSVPIGDGYEQIKDGDRFGKRDRRRPMRLIVEGFTTDGTLVFVRRSTSRRRQPIAAERLVHPPYYRL